jgi:hypothetical protein
VAIDANVPMHCQGLAPGGLCQWLVVTSVGAFLPAQTHSSSPAKSPRKMALAR